MFFYISLAVFVNAYTLPSVTSLEPVSVTSQTRVVEKFWEGVYGEDYLSKLNSKNFTQHISHHEESFVMFYANWCRASHSVKEEFADLAEEIAYTEGFSNISFGAIDCNATISNLMLCRQYNIANYPRFLFFTNGSLDRTYTPTCPRSKVYFYNWIVNRGSEIYCSSAVSVLSQSAPKILVQNVILILVIHWVQSFILYTNGNCK